MSIPTVSACINKIGETISRLPVKLYRKNEEQVEEIFDDPRLKLLNGNTGDTLSTVDMWKAAIEDYYLGSGAWIYVNSNGLEVQSLHYVDSRNISLLYNNDPIFKAYRVQINAQNYYDFQFLKLLRKTRDGYTNITLQEEASAILSAAWNALKLENMMNSNGGCKPGFLKAKNRLSDTAIASIKEGYRKVYDNEQSRDKLCVLNDGVDFEAISSTAAELQMNENKKTNSIEICKLFGFPHTVIDGGATPDDNKKFIAAVISVLNQIETELDNVLLLESEKEQGYYWAFDTKELTRGDMKERYDAYEVAVRNNILQVDEIRREEDYEPLGFNFIKLGLQDVLLNPETMEVYTPNTGQSKNLLTGEERADDLELREYIQLKNGRMNGSTGGGARGSKKLYSNGGAKPKKSVDKSEKDDIIDFESNKNELEKAIADGKLSTKLDKKAQSAHKMGSEEYNKRIEKGGLPSYTELSNMEVQKIINTHSLAGEVHKGKDGQFREVISLKENIGMFGDRRSGKYIPTHRATIHYSKKGTHLVPASPHEGD